MKQIRDAGGLNRVENSMVRRAGGGQRALRVSYHSALVWVDRRWDPLCAPEPNNQPPALSCSPKSPHK
jgi:hypothetical protein